MRFIVSLSVWVLALYVGIGASGAVYYLTYWKVEGFIMEDTAPMLRYNLTVVALGLVPTVLYFVVAVTARMRCSRVQIHGDTEQSNEEARDNPTA